MGKVRDMSKIWFSLLALLPVVVGGEAHAAYSCSVSATSISVVYSPTVATENITTGSWTLSCTRLAGDPATLNFSIAANNGNQPAGGTNRVRRGASTDYYSYELYRLAPYVNGNRWQPGNRITGALAFGAALSATISGPFDLRLPGSQTPVGTAGTYTDNIVMTLRDTTTNTVLAPGGNFNVSVVTTNSCQITTSPGNLGFSYTSFQLAAATANTTFVTRCTTGLPYILSIGANPSTLIGLSYTLGLSASSATGNGSEQIFTINGSIAGGQAGTCAGRPLICGIR